MMSRRACQILALVPVLLLGTGWQRPAMPEKTMTADRSSTASGGANLWNPGIVATYDTDPIMRDTYGLFVKDGRVHTLEYFEGSPLRRTMKAHEPVDWEIRVPAGATLFSLTGGVAPENIEQFWVGWAVDRAVHMEAISDHHAQVVSLAPDEAPIFPGVLGGNGTASLFTWRKAAGTALWLRTFAPKGKTPTLRSVAEIPGQPVSSIVAAVPGERSHHALVGWVEASPRGAVLAIAVLKGERTSIVRSDPVGDSRPLPLQRIGLWAGSLHRQELTAVLLGEGPAAGYVLARFSVKPGAAAGTLSTSHIDLQAGEIASAAIDYYRDNSRPLPHCAILTTDGRVLRDDRDQTRPHLLRAGVPLDSPMPIVTTAGAAYWGERGADGRLSFKYLAPRM
jgi:hypothetical protein